MPAGRCDMALDVSAIERYLDTSSANIACDAVHAAGRSELLLLPQLTVGRVVVRAWTPVVGVHG